MPQLCRALNSDRLHGNRFRATSRLPPCGDILMRMFSGKLSEVSSKPMKLFNSSIDYISNTNTKNVEISYNYTKKIKNHGYNQWWTPAGEKGCFVTSMAYSLA